jgi:four helix bundle protein
MRDFRKLSVWGKSHSLAVEIYQMSSSFPQNEIYGITSQIRRACVSIPANIAEGCGRDGEAEFRRFLQIALGSASELEYHLLLAHDLKMLSEEKHKQLDNRVTEIKRMLTSLIQKLKSDG